MEAELVVKRPRKVVIIGIGAGDPKHLTLEAVEALGSLDVVFIPDKGAEKAELAALRIALLDRFATPTCRRISVPMPQRASAPADYGAAVVDWHGKIAGRYSTLFDRELSEGQTGALLVWGDPALYDSTLRIMDRMADGGAALDIHVIPGISAVQLLAARHGIALHAVGEPVTIMPARALGQGLPAHLPSAVIVLDGEQSFATIEDEDIEIFWGASLGLADEVLIAGPLREVKHEIAAARDKAREAKGWLMDTYLLRRRARPLP